MNGRIVTDTEPVLPCVVCGRGLKHALPNGPEDTNQPNEGVVFIAQGNYGSTVFDPFGENIFLEVNICDDCLIDRSHRGKVILLGMVKDRPVHADYTPWKAPELEKVSDA